MNKRGVVVIVEDEPGIRDVLRLTFEQQGLCCELFGGTKDFLDNYDPRQPGCLILDVRLPDGDGIDMLREARRRGWRIPTIVLTAFGGISSVVSAMKLGTVDYLEKPFEPTALVAVVKEALAVDEAERQQAVDLSASLGRFTELTPREYELLGLICQGKLNKQAASILGISQKTIQNHRASLLKKVQAANTADLVRLATSAGLGGRVPYVVASVNSLQQQTCYVPSGRI